MPVSAVASCDKPTRRSCTPIYPPDRRAQAESGQAAGDTGGFAIEFTPGEADILVADHDGFAIREPGGGVREGLRDGFFQEGHLGPTGIAERWQSTSVTPNASTEIPE